MNESKLNEMAMGYDAHTGLFYMQGVPFTQERLEQSLKYLRTKLKLGSYQNNLIIIQHFK